MAFTVTPILRPLSGKGAGQAGHAVLAGDVRRPVSGADRRELGTDIDDTPPALLNHRTSCGLGAEEQPLEVGVKGGVPVRLSNLEGGLGDADASVVDQNVQLAKVADYPFNHRLDAADVQYVQLVGAALDPLGLHSRLSVAGQLQPRRHIGNCNIRASLSQTDRQSLPNTSGRTRYQRNFSLQA